MDYYNIDSDAFFQQTYDVDMQTLYQPLFCEDCTCFETWHTYLVFNLSHC